MAPTVTTEQAWEQLAEALRQFIFQKVTDAALSEDLLQEVFLRIHQQLPTLRHPKRLEAWVYRIARNVISDHYRKRYRSENVETGLEEETTDAWEQLKGCLDQLVARLDSPYREVLTEVDLHGHSQKAVAQQLNLSYSGLKSRVQRGRKALRDMMVGCCQMELDKSGRLKGVFDPDECRLCKDESA